ncbi:MAG: pilus assembly protein PilM [Phycisphaerales bacterium]|nr:pilus assembly protein PilM [Phycisphaerales bacterium]
MRRTTSRSRHCPAGVECGTDAIRIVQVDRPGGGRVRAAARIEFDSELGKADPGDIRRVTRHLSGRRCVVSPPRHEIVVRPARLPRLTDAEFREAVRWEAAEMLGCNAEELVTEPLLVTRDAEEDGLLDVLIVASSIASIERTLEPLLAVGLLPIAVEPSFLAAGRAYSARTRRQDDDVVVRAVVEVGLDASSMVVMAGDQAIFAKTIEVGGRDFDRVVSERLGIDVKTAGALRRDAAADRVEGSLARPLQDATRRAADELAGEVAMSLRYVAVAARLGAVTMLHLCGEEAATPGLVDAITAACRGISVTREPVVEARFAEAVAIAGGEESDWAVATGLALRPLGRHEQRGRKAA